MKAINKDFEKKLLIFYYRMLLQVANAGNIKRPEFDPWVGKIP